MLRYYFLSVLFFLGVQLHAMQMSSLRHLTLNKICETVDQDLNPELIKKIIQLPESLQAAVCHYLLRADEKRRARYKKVFNVHAQLEFIRAVDLKYLGKFLSDTMCIALSSSGKYVIIGGKLAFSPPTQLSIIDLENNTLLHQERYPKSQIQKTRIQAIKISPDNTYYAVCRNNAVYLYEFSTHTLVRKCGEGCSHIFFHPTKQLLYFYNGSIYELELNKVDQPPLLKLEVKDASCLRFYGNYILVGCKNEMMICDRDFTILKRVNGITPDTFIFMDPYELRMVTFGNNERWIWNWSHLAADRQTVEYPSDSGVPKFLMAYEKHFDCLLVGGSSCPYVCIISTASSPYRVSDMSVIETIEYLESRQIKERELSLRDVYSGWEEDSSSIGKVFMGIVEAVTNESGTAIFTYNSNEKQGYLHQTADFEISLLGLLLIMYSDRYPTSVCLDPLIDSFQKLDPSLQDSLLKIKAVKKSFLSCVGSRHV